jgi:hypothetical protein
MDQERIGPTHEGRAGVLHDGEPGLYEPAPAQKQINQTVLKVKDAHLIGGPRVVINRLPSVAEVYLANAPWGWGSCRIEFLNPRPGGKAERYAAKLQERIEQAAARERERRNRITLAKIEAKLNGGAE